MSTSASDEEAEDLESRQRLKAALHYTVGGVCSEVGEGVTFSREVVAILTETAFKQANLLAMDLELFAKHAKRTTVSVDDVCLCARRSPSLHKVITAQSEKLRAEKAADQDDTKSARKTKGKKNSS